MIAACVVQNAPGIPTPEAIEREVLDNLKHQPLGDGTVEDLALPDEFLRRIADRIVRTSYEERYRIVVQGGVQAPGRDTPVVLYGAIAALLAVVVWVFVARRRK